MLKIKTTTTYQSPSRFFYIFCLQGFTYTPRAQQELEDGVGGERRTNTNANNNNNNNNANGKPPTFVTFFLQGFTYTPRAQQELEDGVGRMTVVEEESATVAESSGSSGTRR